MSRRLLAVLLVLAISIPALASDKKQSASGSVEEQIKALDQQSREAALKGDATFLEKHLADDYIAINGSGMEVTRDQAIQNRKNGVTRFESIDLSGQKVRVYGNTAIVDENAKVKGSMNGQPYAGEFKATFVWVKQGNDWKLVSFQTTPVQNPESAATKK